MLILGLILSVFAIGFFCWLLFTLAVYALPFFVAVTVGLAAYHHDAGLLGAFLTAILAGAATLAIGQLAFALVPSTAIRAVIEPFATRLLPRGFVRGVLATLLASAALALPGSLMNTFPDTTETSTALPSTGGGAGASCGPRM